MFVVVDKKPETKGHAVKASTKLPSNFRTAIQTYTILVIEKLPDLIVSTVQFLFVKPTLFCGDILFNFHCCLVGVKCELLTFQAAHLFSLKIT